MRACSHLILHLLYRICSSIAPSMWLSIQSNISRDICQADTGHALVLFDIMASILAQPRVDAAIHWTSHWSSRTWPALDDDMAAAVVDTLWPDQRPTALGTAFELLARLLRAGELLQVLFLNLHASTCPAWQLMRQWPERRETSPACSPCSSSARAI